MFWLTVLLSLCFLSCSNAAEFYVDISNVVNYYNLINLNINSYEVKIFDGGIGFNNDHVMQDLGNNVYKYDGNITNEFYAYTITTTCNDSLNDRVIFEELISNWGTNLPDVLPCVALNIIGEYYRHYISSKTLYNDTWDTCDCTLGVNDFNRYVYHHESSMGADVTEHIVSDDTYPRTISFGFNRQSECRHIDVNDLPKLKNLLSNDPSINDQCEYTSS